MLEILSCSLASFTKFIDLVEKEAELNVHMKENE